ncbi:DUF4333 domain-containing protein [Gordonia hydrophobica]|uniref:DUF4333 domain-containing protein n=1 Tax=Gordonia hydrophobica TaxID=40516 RepID=A0ABZ2TW38_9ACTN|nr:DUF4333 domain-containing protein [Gordonia hydrophobica]MBM7365902.1 hypothetical protein [Gordonia hydrophobica]
MITRRLGALLVLGLAAPTIASCSFSIGGSSVDLDKVKTAITDEFNEKLQPLGHSVDDVVCDDPGKNADDGDTFKCIATASGATFNVVATVAKPDVKFESTEVAYDMAHVARLLTTEVNKQVTGVTVNCGEGLKAYAPGTTFNCDATDTRGQSGTVVYSVTKNGKNDTWKLN